MGKPAIRVFEADAANDFPSLLTRVRAGAEVVIERDAEAVAVIRPTAPHVRLLSESLQLAKAKSSLLEEPWVQRVLTDPHDGHPPRLRVHGIQQRVERVGHESRRNAQQRRGGRLQPSISHGTRNVRSFDPVCRKARHAQVFDSEIVRRTKLQHAVIYRQVANVNLQVDQSFQQCRRGTLAAVDDPSTTRVPATGCPQSPSPARDTWLLIRQRITCPP